MQASSTFACQHCGALYEVTVVRLRVVERDKASCTCCGRVMVAWNTANPQFTLIIEGEGRSLPCTVVWRLPKQMGVRFSAPGNEAVA